MQSKFEYYDTFKALNDKWVAGNDYSDKLLFEKVNPLLLPKEISKVTELEDPPPVRPNPALTEVIVPDANDIEFVPTSVILP